MTIDPDHLYLSPWHLKLTEVYTALMVGFIDEPEVLDWLIGFHGVEDAEAKAELKLLLLAHERQWENNNRSSLELIDKSFDPTKTADGRTIKSICTDYVAKLQPSFDLRADTVQAFVKELFEIRLLRYRFPTRHTPSWSFYRMVGPICEIYDAPDWIAFWRTAIESHPNIRTIGQPTNEIIESYIYFDNLPKSVQGKITEQLRQIAQRRALEDLNWQDSLQHVHAVCDEVSCDRAALNLVLEKKLTYYCSLLRPTKAKFGSSWAEADHSEPLVETRLTAEQGRALMENVYRSAGKEPPEFDWHELKKSFARVDDFVKSLPRVTDPKDISDSLRETETSRLKHQILEEHRRKREHTRRTDAVLTATHNIQGPLQTARTIIESTMSNAQLSEHAGLFSALLEIQDLTRTILDELSYKVQVDVEPGVRLETARLSEQLAMLNFLKQDAELEGISLEIEAPDVVVTLGWFEFESVVYEVIKNAIKHNTSGQSVVAKFDVTDDTITVVVEDDGLGISDDELGQIFQLGYRVTRADSPSVPGTGRGLYDVHRAVERLGGSIDIVNRPQGGSRVTVQAPCTWSNATRTLAS